MLMSLRSTHNHYSVLRSDAKLRDAVYAQGQFLVTKCITVLLVVMRRRASCGLVGVFCNGIKNGC